MSKKHKRGREQNRSPSSQSSQVRKQKAANYAERELKKQTEIHSPMGKYSPMGNDESENIIISEMPNDFGRNDKGKSSRQKYSYTQRSAAVNLFEPSNAAPNIGSDKPQATGGKSISSIADSMKKSAYLNNKSEQIKSAGNQTHSEVTDGKSIKKADPDTVKQFKKSAYVKNQQERKEAVEAKFISFDEFMKMEEDNRNSDNLTEENISDNSDSKLIERRKKAAYIKEMTEQKLALGVIIPDGEGQEQSETQDDISDEKVTENVNAPANDEEEKKQESPPQTAEFKENYIRSYAQRQYSAQKKSAKNPAADKDNKSPLTNAIEVVTAVSTGNAMNVAALPIKHIVKDKLPDSKLIRAAKTTSEAVKSSDSVGGAAVNVGTTFAADKVKQYAIEKITGTPKTDRKSKKYHHIKREKAKSGENRKSRKASDSAKNFSAKNLKLKRLSQKKFYLKKNGGEIISNAAARPVKQHVKKAILSKLIMFAAPVLFTVFMILIVLMLISSLFSWLNPFDYSLAGDENADTETRAETEGEILDGYVLMTRNYLDVAQAEYYLEYGDWFGGTYDYPSAESELSFSEFFAAKCDSIISSIREQYEAAIANAQSPQEAAAIAAAMGQAISAALAQAQQQAETEYSALIEQLDDSMTAEEKRQHYEVVDSGGTNGVKDNIEFNGKPIAGTNFFENVEIQSDLSAEKIMSMIALYKSLTLMQTNGETEDGSEYEYNITPDDIMKFFEDTEYIKITADITHNNSCSGNCRRRLIGDYDSGFSWEYYCNGDHDNISGRIEPCISKDELLEKIMELTEAEENGFDSEKCEEMIDEYMKSIKKELDIDESDYRQFGANDNERAKEFYEMLIDPEKGEIPNNYWEINTPCLGEESEENTNEQT